MDKQRKRERRRGGWSRKFFLFLLLAGVLAVAAASGGGRVDAEPEPTSALPLNEEVTASQPVEGDAEEDPADEEPESWQLRLVNPWNPLPEDYTVSLAEVNNGNDQAVDKRCYASLKAMINACREEGLRPLICSSYRSMETQQRLYQAKVEEFLERGYSQEQAEEEAGKIVAVPGTSEHQLGLAVDIVDARHQVLDESQERTKVQKWLIEHCWEYGFILRYPNEKSDITGIIYEPWHYRYVGRDIAKEITEQGVCLEEYLEARSKT